jgi:hypothetical protein
MLDSTWKLFQQNKYLGYKNTFTLEFPEFYNAKFNVDRKKIIWPSKANLETFFDKAETWDNEVGFIVLKNSYFFHIKYMQQALNSYSRIRTSYGKTAAERIIDIAMIPFIDSNLNMSSSQMKDSLSSMFTKATQNNPAQIEELTFNYYSYFLQTSKRYSEYTAVIDTDIKKNRNTWNNEGINNTAWEIYENTKDTSALKTALNWMQQVVKDDDIYEHEDTYAHLLFALEKLDEAETAANVAIEIATKEKLNFEATKKLIRQINASR